VARIRKNTNTHKVFVEKPEGKSKHLVGRINKVSAVTHPDISLQRLRKATNPLGLNSRSPVAGLKQMYVWTTGRQLSDSPRI
jgi:hypothetical protein